MAIELLNGAFITEFEKGEDGKPGKWVTKPVLEKIGKKKEEKHTGKEEPLFPLIYEIEKTSGNNFRNNIKNSVIEIAQYLKQVSK